MSRLSTWKFLISLLSFALSGCAGSAHPTASFQAAAVSPAPGHCSLPAEGTAANHQGPAISRSDAEVKKTRGASRPLFQVRVLHEAAGRTVRPAGEAASR